MVLDHFAMSCIVADAHVYPCLVIYTKDLNNDRHGGLTGFDGMLC